LDKNNFIESSIKTKKIKDLSPLVPFRVNPSPFYGEGESKGVR
jgi:hypothetical protein